MKVLVTGGAGYLGSVLVPMLLSFGHRVTVLDNFQHGVPSLVEAARHRTLTVVDDDVRAWDRTAALFREADAVIHLAAIVGARACDADQAGAFYVNFLATREIVDVLRPDQVLIFPCTNSGYGKGGEQPCTEDDPMRPVSLYGRTKVLAEEAILRHPRGISLRFATLCGASPRMRIDLMVNDVVWHAALRQTFGLYEGDFRRCVLHVRDAANAILTALSCPDRLAGKPWNVGGQNLTKRELCDRIKVQVPSFVWSDGGGVDQDQRDYFVSSDAFCETSGWWAGVDLHEGIAELLRVYQAGRLWVSDKRWANA